MQSSTTTTTTTTTTSTTMTTTTTTTTMETYEPLPTTSSIVQYGVQKDLTLVYLYRRQTGNIVSCIFRIPELFERVLSFEDVHKKLVTTSLYGYRWMEYPRWCSGFIQIKKLFMVTKLACTCKEMYNKIVLYMNPSLVSDSDKIKLLNEFEIEFWSQMCIDESLLDSE